MKFIERYDEILESYKKESETVRKMEEFARSCNFEDFDAFSNNIKNVEAFSKANDIIFTKRNEKWLPKIKQAMQEAPTLFDFGAGHLVGDDGVLKMLRDAGYEVTLLTKKRE